MSHYYTKNQTLESKPKALIFNYKNHIIRLKSDIGTFSKNNIDYGSRLLIETIKDTDLRGKVLDIGCGYGVIGISLATNPDILSVDMVDVNDRAIVLTNENIKLNKLKHVSAYESDGYCQVNGLFDMIVSNPPIRAGKTVVHRILGEAYQYLNDGGCLYTVIQKKQGAPSAIKLLEQIFEHVEVLEKSKGYYIIYAKKTLQ